MKNIKNYNSFCKLNELNIIHKEPYGKGSFNRIFDLKSDTNKIIKIGKDAIEHGILFQKFPDFFPIVYKISPPSGKKNGYIILEKLDDKKAKNDFNEFINKDRGYIHNWGINTFINDNEYNELKERITTNFGKNMLNRIREIVIHINMKDIHSGNFGYDKNGILKALDI